MTNIAECRSDSPTLMPQPNKATEPKVPKLGVYLEEIQECESMVFWDSGGPIDTFCNGCTLCEDDGGGWTEKTVARLKGMDALADQGDVAGLKAELRSLASLFGASI